MTAICLLQPSLQNVYSSETAGQQIDAKSSSTMLAQVEQPPLQQPQQVSPLPSVPNVPTLGGVALAPGDVVSVEVKGEPTLTGIYYVRPEGDIQLPMAGSIRAAGLTATQLSDQITEQLRRFVVNPVVTVLRLSGESRVVSILGAVTRPGTYDIRQYPTTLALIGAAGGTTAEADLQRMVLVRDDETAPLTKAVGEGQLVIPTDVRLEAGDAIVVPSMRERSVRIVGAVAQPGLAAIEQALTASRAVLAAGGPTAAADLTQVQILRGSEVLQVNLRPILRPEAARTEMVEDVVLQLDDIVMVPQTATQSVHVAGAVRAPGEQDAEGVGVASTAVVAAGGATENGDLSRAYVLRGGERIPLDLMPLLQPDQAAPDAEATDVSVRAGDVVVVPERNPIFVIGAVNEPGGVPAGRATSLSQAIVMAGGLAPDADATDAFVLRQGRQIRADLRALMQEGDESADLQLQPQDAIVVPRRSQVVRVVGQVVQPGAVPLESAETLVDALGIAGGATPLGDTRGVIFLRGGESRSIDFDAIMHGDDLAQNVALQAGDTIIVPRIEEEVYVLGAVVEPGSYPIREGDTIIDVIAEAGGPSTVAQVNRIAVVRRSEVRESRGADARDGIVQSADAPATAEERRPRVRESAPADAVRGGPHARQRSLSASHYRPRAAAERLERPAREESTVDERLRVGDRGFHLLELAEVESGNPAYLLQPGDVIYVPPRDLTQRVWQDLIGDLLLGLTLGALFD